MKTAALLALLLLTTTAQAQVQLYSPQGKYLGNLNSNRFDPNSTSNQFGRYGSQFSPDSINNQFGRYGSQFSPDGVRNQFGGGGFMRPLTLD